MPEDLLVRFCSPTLANLKTGSLFSCPFPDKAEMERCLRNWNRLLGRRGLRVLGLRYRNGRALVYIYRPDRLSRDLHCTLAQTILQQSGYETDIPDRCLVDLVRKLRSDAAFPHEIGLFLGYPPEDVLGFIRDANGQKLTGTWKVYGDVETAKSLFARYEKCTDVYCRLFETGHSLEQLAVAG